MEYEQETKRHRAKSKEHPQVGRIIKAMESLCHGSMAAALAKGDMHGGSKEVAQWTMGLPRAELHDSPQTLLCVFSPGLRPHSTPQHHCLTPVPAVVAHRLV